MDRREQHNVITSFGNYTSLGTLLITPRSRVLHEKLTGSQIVKNFPTFYGTRMFVIALTTSSHQIFHSLGCTKGSVQARSKCIRFVTRPFFFLRRVVRTSPNPQLQDHSLSAVRYCLFNILATTLHIGGRSYMRRLETLLESPKSKTMKCERDAARTGEDRN